MTMPKWSTIVLVALLSGYTMYDRTNSYSDISSKLNKIKDLFSQLNNAIVELDVLNFRANNEEIIQKDKDISFLKATIDRLKALLADKENQKPSDNKQDSEPTQAELSLNVMLKKLQKLEIDVEDFGVECSAYFRKEFSKTLRVCGMEFVDYSEENKSIFDTESAAITNVDCTAKAIVTISSPRRVVLRGHAFIPDCK